MPYAPLSAFYKKGIPSPKQSAQTTAYQGITEDLRDLPQLMKPNQALEITNYVVTTDGGLSKRNGLVRHFTGTGGRISMIQKYSDDYYIIGYDDKVSAIAFSNGAETVIHTYAQDSVYSGQRYGGYFFITNNINHPARISRTLAWDAQVTPFTVGSKLTGTTSGATATILETTGAAATGTLTLANITAGPLGFFQDNEPLIDSAGGSATENGILVWSFSEISTIPICAIMKVVGPRLYLGNLQSDNTAVAYSATDTGINPPFTNWTVGSAASDPGLVNYRNAGTVAAIDSLGANIVVLAATGKWAFLITTLSNNNIIQKQDQTVLERIDMGGSRASITTPTGMFYVNRGGIWIIQSIGQSNVPFSEQEVKSSFLLGNNYFDDIDLTNADFVYNPKTDTIFLTCARSSDANNLVIAYNIPTQTFSEFTGWNINRFMNNNNLNLCGASSSEATVWELFVGNDDDGTAIWSNYYQELKTGDLQTRQFLKGEYIDAFMVPEAIMTIAFDIYDVQGNFIPNYLVLEMSPTTVPGSGDGWGQAAWGNSSWGGDEDLSGMVEWFDGARAMIRNYQRIRVRITTQDKNPHKLVWFKVQAEVKIDIRRRQMRVVS